jgi:TolB-like protein/Tfp pilus assembly protein PilF
LVLDGAKLQALRKAKGLSRMRLSDLSKGGVHSLSEATLKRAENGEPVYSATAHSLAQLLDVPLEDLLLVTTVLAMPQQPMIAVMPLQAWSADAQPFADGLAEDVITRLSRWWFPILARTSSLGAAPIDARAAARAAGAKYWVDGSVRRDGDRLRVTVQFADVDSGTIISRRAYDRPFVDVFDVQRELAGAVLSELSPRVLDAEIRSFDDRDPEDLDAWQEALVGAWHFYRRTAQDNAQARALLEHALRRDKRMPLAWHTLALAHQQDLINQWCESPQRSLLQLEEVSGEFERLYPEEAWAQVSSAYLDVYKGRRASAMARLVAAIEADPNGCLAYTLYGQTLAMNREPDRGLEQFEVALRLNPRDTERWSTYTGMALAHFVAERYEETIDAAQEAVRIRPNASFAYATLASAHSRLNHMPEARQAVQSMLAIQPDMSLRGILSIMGSTDEDIRERYLEGLKRAGLGG